MRLRDHGNNFSSGVSFDAFVISGNLSAFCQHPQLTIPTSECTVLSELYSGTNGSGRTNHDGRFSTVNVEDRFGIKTIGSSNPKHVEGIYLQKSTGPDVPGVPSQRDGNNLSGNLPTSMSGLIYLKDLYLSKNQIDGNLPVDLPSLSALQRLYAYDNQLTGSLMTGLQRLTGLQILDLHNNTLHGSLPAALGEMTGLQGLDLSSNAFV